MTTPLTKLIAENKERPIAEAPRDGTEVIARNQYNDVTAAYYSAATNEWHYSMAGDWQFCGVTHFRPLPDDRLADICAVFLDALQHIEANARDTTQYEVAIAANAIRNATAIAEGKE